MQPGRWCIYVANIYMAGDINYPGRGALPVENISEARFLPISLIRASIADAYSEILI